MHRLARRRSKPTGKIKLGQIFWNAAPVNTAVFQHTRTEMTVIGWNVVQTCRKKKDVCGALNVVSRNGRNMAIFLSPKIN
nr:unnamed protein product [Callosobruchus chinensis]